MSAQDLAHSWNEAKTIKAGAEAETKHGRHGTSGQYFERSSSTLVLARLLLTMRPIKVRGQLEAMPVETWTQLSQVYRALADLQSQLNGPTRRTHRVHVGLALQPSAEQSLQQASPSLLAQVLAVLTLRPLLTVS